MGDLLPGRVGAARREEIGAADHACVTRHQRGQVLGGNAAGSSARRHQDRGDDANEHGDICRPSPRHRAHANQHTTGQPPARPCDWRENAGGNVGPVASATPPTGDGAARCRHPVPRSTRKPGPAYEHRGRAAVACLWHAPERTMIEPHSGRSGRRLLHHGLLPVRPRLVAAPQDRRPEIEWNIRQRRRERLPGSGIEVEPGSVVMIDAPGDLGCR